MLKQQEEASVGDGSSKASTQSEVAATTENTDKSAVQQQVSLGGTPQMKSSSPVKSSSATTVSEEQDWYSSQYYKDLVAEYRKEGYTDERIYYGTHLGKALEIEMGSHIWEIKDMVKDICDKNGFDYYERPGHVPDMEAILKKNGTKGKSIYEAMNQAFSNFEKTIWQQTAKEREGFSFTHDNGFEGTIWEVLIPPSADPNKSRDPLSFIN